MSLRPRTQYRHYRGHQRIVEPAQEPVTVQQAADQLRLDDPQDSPMLEMYIAAAREQAEAVTGLALITQTWRLTLDYWPAHREPWWDGVRQLAISELRTSGYPGRVELPRYPLQDVDNVRVFDTDGSSESIDVPATFIVDTEQKPGRLVLRTGAAWPVALQRANGIEIEYKAGYGDNPADVPAPLRLAILQMVATMHERRGDDCTVEDAMQMSGAGAMLNRYKVLSL